MLVSAEKDTKTPSKHDSKFKKENPGYDRDKTYQVVGYGQPKKVTPKTGRSFIRHSAIRWHSSNDKRDAIRFVRKLLRWQPDRFSHFDVYGADNTLLAQFHYNKQERRIVSEEL